MSQKDGYTEEIGGSVYEIYPLPPLQAHKLLLRIMKMIAQPIEKTVGSAVDGASPGEAEDFLDQEVGAEFIARAAAAIIDGIDEKTTDDLIDALRKVTLVDGVKLDGKFDLHFQGEPLAFYQWIYAGVKAQWGKLFSASEGAAVRGALNAVLKGKTGAKASTSPSTSTG